MKNICLLGATGSIGQSTLDIIKANPNEYCLKAFSFNQNIDRARQIIEEFNPTFVASPVNQHIESLKKEYPALKLSNNIYYNSLTDFLPFWLMESMITDHLVL